MLSPKFEPILRFLEKHQAKLEIVDSAYVSLEFPDFELTPMDYLDFARAERQNNSLSAKINCVAHIKRAVECELDTLLHILGIAEIKRKFPTKMEFVCNAGMVTGRSLVALNRVRNKVEHEYQSPDLDDIDIYLDLAESFVMSLEGFIYMLKLQPGVVCGFYDYSVPHIGVHPEPKLRALIVPEEQAIEFELLEDGATNKIHSVASDIIDYAEALKILVLLVRSGSMTTVQHVVSKLGGTPDYGHPNEMQLG